MKVDELRSLLGDAPTADEAARSAVAQRAQRVVRPPGALDRLDRVAAWLAGWHGTDRPQVTRPSILVFAGDHGVVEENVSTVPGSVTAAVADALRGGQATASVLAAEVGATFELVDAGIGRPTANLAREPAMSDTRFSEALELGRSVVRGLDADLLVVGEMGIGNTTSAAAVACLVFGMTPEDWTGRGTGVDDAGLARKIDVVRRACARAGDVDPIEALRQVGGTELVAIAGAVVEARLRSLPVVLDGFVVTAAVAPLARVHPDSLEHCIAGHRSPEPGHSLLLEKLGKEPLLDLGLRLGEGSGALAAVPLIRLAVKGVTDVATFEELGLDV